jgi:hypothetical protein
MMPQRKQIAVERSPDILHGRAGYRIHADWGHVGVLEGGGHICELILDRVPGVNPLWKPPWTTIDPDRYQAGRHRRAYGPPPDGKLLAGIAGHNLSFDHFGPPSKEESAAGLATHGEAPCTRWKLTQGGRSLRPTLKCNCVLRHAQIGFHRVISLSPTDPVIYCQERAENRSRYDRPISWNQHVTFGPPFVEADTTIFDMPATRAKVAPPEYRARIFIRPDAEFTWPNAPGKDAQSHNLRKMPKHRYGHYTAQLLDPNLGIAFVSACNPRQRLLVVYAFRRADFPWVGNWEEHHNRTPAPWKGRTFCRGMEFSTTPFAIPRRQTIDQGPLFGETTYRWLAAKSSLTTRYLILLFMVPEDFAGVSRLTLAGGRAQVVEASPGGRELGMAVENFL